MEKDFIEWSRRNNAAIEAAEQAKWDAHEDYRRVVGVGIGAVDADQDININYEAASEILGDLNAAVSITPQESSTDQMNPFAVNTSVTPLISSAELRPVTRRRLAQFADPTSQQAADALGGVNPKKETNKEKKIRLRAAARRLAAIDLASGLEQMDVDAQDRLSQATTTPTTVARPAGMLGSGMTIVDYGVQPGTVEYAKQQILPNLRNVFANVRGRKIEKIQEDVDAQKFLLLELYLGLGKDPTRLKLLSILKGLGLVNENITIKDLGLKKGYTKEQLNEAIRNYIGNDLVLSEEKSIALAEAAESEKIRSKEQRAAVMEGLSLDAGLQLERYLSTRRGDDPTTEDLEVMEVNRKRFEEYKEARRREVRKQEAEYQASLVRTEVWKRAGTKGEIPKPTVKDRETLRLQDVEDSKLKKGDPPYKKDVVSLIKDKTVADPRPGFRGDKKIQAIARPILKKKEVKDKGKVTKLAQYETEATTIREELLPLLDGIKEVGEIPIEKSNIASIIPVTDNQVDNFLETERSYRLIGDALSSSEVMFDDQSKDWLGVENVNSKKYLNQIYPKGKDLYSFKYFEETKIIDTETGKTVKDLKEEIAERTGRKVKDVVAVSPAGTYVVLEKPKRGKIWVAKRGERGELIYNDEGLPEGELREFKSNELKEMPPRLVAYDKSDQSYLSQQIDDIRNWEIRAALTRLLGRYRQEGKTKADIKISDLAEIANKYGIETKFVGVILKGETRFVELKEMFINPETGERQVLTGEEQETMRWYRSPNDRVMYRYKRLGELASTFRKLLDAKGILNKTELTAPEMKTAESAWTEAVEFHIKQLAIRGKIEEKVIRDEYAEKDDYKGKKKDLEQELKDREVYMTPKETESFRSFVNEHRDRILDPSDDLSTVNLVPADPVQIYNSLLNSAKTEVAAFGQQSYSESKANFLERASDVPTLPRNITKGTKVTLIPEALGEVVKSDPLLNTITEDIIRSEKLLGERLKIDDTGKVITAKEGDELYSSYDNFLNRKEESGWGREFANQVDLMVEEDMAEGPMRPPIMWSDSDIKTRVEAAGLDLKFKWTGIKKTKERLPSDWVTDTQTFSYEIGGLYSPSEISIEHWREQFEKSYWDIREAYLRNNTKEINKTVKAQREKLSAIYRRRLKLKRILSQKKIIKEGEAKRIRVEAWEDEASLVDALTELSLAYEKKVGIILGQEWNVKRVDGLAVELEPTQVTKGVQSIKTLLSQVAVVSLSQQSINRIDASQLAREIRKERSC